MLRGVVAVFAILFASSCAPPPPPAHFACADCARTDLLVGEPIAVHASIGQGEVAPIEVHCSLVCHVEASHDDPEVTLVTPEQPGLMKLTVDVLNTHTGKNERYEPPALEVHAPESLELLCSVQGEAGVFAPCGSKPFDRRPSPYVVVVGHRGGTSRALYRAFLNGQRSRGLRDPSGRVTWFHRYQTCARPEELEREFKGWSLRPGAHQVRAEAAGVAAEATIDVR